MTTTNIESTTLFDRLPTEIIFIIFNYLSSNDIIYTFFFFNQRFNNLLLQNQCYLTYLEFPTTNLKIWENILSIIGSQIECLNINTNYLSFPLKYFSNLKSIILSLPYGLPDKELKSFIESEQFKNLQSFKVKDNKIFPDSSYYDIMSDKDYLFPRIFNYGNSLKTLTIPLYYTKGIDNLKINFSLRSMTLIIIHFENIFSLLKFTPNLEYLNIDSNQFDTTEHQISIDKTNIKLKQLYLTLHDHRMALNRIDQVTNFIKPFSTSLNCLSLNLIYLCTSSNEIPFNSIKLQQFLESMIELKQFHLYAKLNQSSIDPDEILCGFQNQYWFDQNESSIGPDQILCGFQNQYWFDHNLSFGMHRNYFYTLPFHFDTLYEFYYSFMEVKSNNPEILINNRRIWFNVKSIELEESFYYDTNFVKELKIKMPKLNSITFSNDWRIRKCKPQLLSSIKDERERIDLTLDNVTAVQFPYRRIEDRKDWIIPFLPNLRHLSLFFSEPRSIDSDLVTILNERIRRLDIRQSSEFKRSWEGQELSEISYLYFSNVEYVNFCLSDFNQISVWWAKDFIMKILINFKNLRILLVYTLPTFGYYIDASYETKLSEVIGYLDMNAIRKNYKVKHFRQYALFLKREFIESQVEDMASLTSRKYSVSSRLIRLFFRKKGS